ncbi:MAG: uroporphyrinogen-III synthase [Candidatus Eisenbacteria bacterium]|nr:uroporphyrinogen-III synthase [Candidatus Eisenbacteria bacterium]
MSDHPLRVAVTRDEGLHGPLAEALRRRGLDPVSCPVCRTVPAPDPEPLRRAAREIGRFHWMVVASPRALAAIMTARSGAPLPVSLRTAAVGAKTAAMLSRAGARSPLVPPTAGAAALIETLHGADEWAERDVLIPRALDGGRDLAASLRRSGAQVAEVVAYRTVTRPAADIARAWRAARPEAVVVASPSAARGLVRALGVDEMRRLACVAAIGATTATQLEALGVPATMSARADLDALADLLALGPHAHGAGANGRGAPASGRAGS